MAEIKSLTEAQKAAMPAYAEKWINIGLSTVDPENPIDRDAVARAIPKVYKSGNYEPPKDIIYVQSPIAAVYAARLALAAPEWDHGWPTNLEELEELAEPHRGVSVTHFLCYGSFDASWLSFYDFFKTECGIEECSIIDGFFEMAEHAGWFFTLSNACIVSEKPLNIRRDNEFRLHSPCDLAIDWTDDYGFASIHGIRVPEKFVLNPEKIEPDEVMRESNTELRRIMMEQYGQTADEIRGYPEEERDATRRRVGPQRFIKDADAETVHEDSYGTLLRVPFQDDEDLMFVRVTNSTPEPDGTYKDYYLQVPPTMRKAREAVAWLTPLGTLDGPGLAADEYAPLIET